MASGFQALNERLKRTLPAYMILVALVTGLLGGYGAVGFRLLIESLQEQFWRSGDSLIATVRELPWYWVVLVPAAGGLLVGTIVARFAPETKGHGVPEVMEAVALRDGFIRARVVVAKALASGLCIASGGSVGREGPIVQIGSAVGSTLGQVLRVGPRRLRTMVGCGAAAGVAATFNAPVAGALFAVEVILGDFAVPQFSPIVISSVAATVVSRHYLGDVPAFEIPIYDLVHPLELGAYAVLGLLAALVAVLFIRVLYRTEDVLERVRAPLPLKACAGGLCVGTLALAFPGVLGVGYESIERALVGPTAWHLLAGLLLAKLIAVSITLGSGGSGGVFAPSLFLGAMLGGLVGTAVNALIPGHSGPTGAYALVGMGAVVAATTHAPLTAILILFELTGDYEIMLPLMASAIVATLLATHLDRESIYTVKLLRRGVNIRAGQDIDILARIPVREVIRREVPTVLRSEPLPRLLARFSSGKAGALYVVGDDATFEGVISFRELRPALRDTEALRTLVVADDIASPGAPSVAVTDTLDCVLEQLDLGYRDELPVLEDGRLVGVIHLEDVLARYRKEVFSRQAGRTTG